MSCTEELLGTVSRSIEAELKPRLGGLLGGMIRAYLPQTWEFRTEEGSTALVVDRDGRVTIAAGPPSRPDVTVEIPHDGLREVLLRRATDAVPADRVKVTPHTAKGRTAFGMLRSRLGL